MIAVLLREVKLVSECDYQSATRCSNSLHMHLLTSKFGKLSLKKKRSSDDVESKKKLLIKVYLRAEEYSLKYLEIHEIEEFLIGPEILFNIF